MNQNIKSNLLSNEEFAKELKAEVPTLSQLDALKLAVGINKRYGSVILEYENALNVVAINQAQAMEISTRSRQSIEQQSMQWDKVNSMIDVENKRKKEEIEHIDQLKSELSETWKELKNDVNSCRRQISHTNDEPKEDKSYQHELHKNYKSENERVSVSNSHTAPSKKVLANQNFPNCLCLKVTGIAALLYIFMETISYMCGNSQKNSISDRAFTILSCRPKVVFGILLSTCSGVVACLIEAASTYKCNTRQL